jgi:DNA polymerase-4
LKIRWPDFETHTRQLKVEQPTDHDQEIYLKVLELLDSIWKPGQPVRLLGVGVADLGAPWRQLSLFDRDWEEEERLHQALDHIRSRFGPDAVKRAGSLSKKRYGQQDEQA